MWRLLICGLATCAGAQLDRTAQARASAPAAPTAPAPAEHRNRPFAISISVMRRAGGAITQDSVLKTDEDFEIRLHNDEKAHVYVFGINAANETARLIPPPDADAVLEPGEHRIPLDPQSWLYLKPPAGQERLVVVASRGLVANIDTEIANIIGERSRSAQTPTAATGAPAKPAPADRRASSSPITARERTRKTTTRSGHRPDWTPDPARLSALHPRGLIARSIDVRSEGVQRVSADDGLIVYVLAFSHKANL